MKTKARIGRLCLAIALLTCAAAHAAPITSDAQQAQQQQPSQQRLPDEIRSVGGIKQAALVVDPLPPELSREGVDAGQVKQKVQSRLEKAGFTIVDSQDAPLLAVKAIAATDPGIPDGMMVIFFLEVQQRVKVQRLQADLKVPTCTLLAYSVARKDKVATVVDLNANLLVERLVEAVQLASRTP